MEMGYGTSGVLAKQAMTMPGNAVDPRGDYADQPKRQPAIPVQLEMLISEIEGLHKAISALEAKLSPVVRPEGPSTGGVSGDSRAMATTPLVGAISEMHSRVTLAYARVMSLVDRCEL